ncbi:MAG TPA: serpin family protein, partial [Bacteroidales bacterium]|nr:serpin family protein [Bacteroidales bacterium]
GGQTKTAFEEAMFLSGLTTEQINQAKKELVGELLNADPSVTLSIANSVWYREGFSVNPNFIKVNQDFYDAEVLEAPFDNSTINLINSWVSDNTNGKIDKIIESIEPFAVMFLMNAVYFYGNWKYQFDEANTENSDFNLLGGTKINVPFMNQQSTARIMESVDFDLLEMPYGRGNFSMLIFLPHEDKSIDDIMNQFNIENYNTWLSSLVEMTVDISIPKFKFGYEKVLNDYLKAMGLSVAFDSENADFSNINDQMDLFISFVKHKSFIDVNEKGTEAAAVTIIGYETTSVPSYPKFIANRPFLFAIREKYTNSILFVGQVVNPSVE